MTNGNHSSFGRTMLVFTLCFWVAYYLLFTLRSIALDRPYLEIQALLRLAMMPVGLILCAWLFAAYGRVANYAVRYQTFIVLILIFAAALTYGTVNYVVFYVLPGLWRTEHGALAKIGLYVTTTNIWTFGLWTAVFYLTRARMTPPRTSAVVADEGRRSPFESDVWVREHGRSIRIPLSAISWFEAEGDYVRLHTEQRSHLYRATMTKLEQTLDGSAFVRIHRRIIISARTLVSLRRRDGRLFAELSNGEQLPVGRHYLPRLKGVPLVPQTADDPAGGFADICQDYSPNRSGT